jgi:hypothetical protein
LYKINIQQKQQQELFFLFVVTENGITQKLYILIFFKLGKLVVDYHLLLPSKPQKSDIFGLENIDFGMLSPLKFSQFF